MHQFDLLYNCLISTELQQVANCPIFPGQVLNSNLLWFFHFLTKGDFLNSRQGIFYLVFQETTLISTQQLMTWDKLPVMFYVGDCKGCKKKPEQLFVLHEIQDRNWVRFTLTFHMTQLSCFLLQLLLLQYLSMLSSLPCPTCNIIHSLLSSFPISIFWEMQKEKRFPLPQLYWIWVTGPFSSHVFQGGVGPVRICPSLMLFSH